MLDILAPFHFQVRILTVLDKIPKQHPLSMLMLPVKHIQRHVKSPQNLLQFLSVFFVCLIVGGVKLEFIGFIHGVV